MMQSEDSTLANQETEMLAMEDVGTPCSSFFQQRGSIDYKNYLRLKNQEKLVLLQYKAAAIIQAAWRGFLIRENMKIVLASIIKIQALMRGALARKQYRPIILERLEQKRLEKLNKAATKIQAAWRGFRSRKYAFDFKVYKDLLKKNADLGSAIKKINDLETLLGKQLNLGQSQSGSSLGLFSKYGSLSSLSSSSFGYSGTLEGLVKSSFNELSNSMSKCRIEELLTYVATSPSDPIRNKQDLSSATSIKQKTSSVGERVRIRDSVDNIFPEFPDDVDGLVKPDPEKVEALKKAIRLLREKIKKEDLHRLQKEHYLLRTKNIPGVYSNIYSNDLTDFEKKLQAVKFHNSAKSNSKRVPERKKISAVSRTDVCGSQPAAASKRKNESQGNSVTTTRGCVCTDGKNLRRQLNLRKRASNLSDDSNKHTYDPSSPKL